MLSYDLAYDSDLSTDVSGDDVNLLMEYALNLDPTANNRGNTTKRAVTHEGLYLNYYATQAGVSYVVDVSTNLQTWSTNGVALSTIGSDNRRSAYTPITGPKKFLRLTVEAAAPAGE